MKGKSGQRFVMRKTIFSLCLPLRGKVRMRLTMHPKLKRLNETRGTRLTGWCELGTVGCSTVCDEPGRGRSPTVRRDAQALSCLSAFLCFPAFARGPELKPMCPQGTACSMAVRKLGGRTHWGVKLMPD